MMRVAVAAIAAMPDHACTGRAGPRAGLIRRAIIHDDELNNQTAPLQ